MIAICILTGFYLRQMREFSKLKMTLWKEWVSVNTRIGQFLHSKDKLEMCFNGGRRSSCEPERQS